MPSEINSDSETYFDSSPLSGDGAEVATMPVKTLFTVLPLYDSVKNLPAG